MNQKLYRSETNRLVGGVCGGLAEYLRADPLLLRIAFVVAAMVNGVGLVVYILLWIFVPAENQRFSIDDQDTVRSNVNEIRQRTTQWGHEVRDTLDAGWRQRNGQAAGQSSSQNPLLIMGIALVILGALVLLRNIGLLWWVGELWPLVLVAVGLVLLLNNLGEQR